MMKIGWLKRNLPMYPVSDLWNIGLGANGETLPDRVGDIASPSALVLVDADRKLDKSALSPEATYVW